MTMVDSTDDDLVSSESPGSKSVATPVNHPEKAVCTVCAAKGGELYLVEEMIQP